MIAFAFRGASTRRHHVFETGKVIRNALATERTRSDPFGIEQEIETWVKALAHYDNNEFEEAIKVFDNIADTSKILFNCGVIYATLGEHLKAVGQLQSLCKWMAMKIKCADH